MLNPEDHFQSLNIELLENEALFPTHKNHFEKVRQTL